MKKLEIDAKADFPIFNRKIHGHPLVYLDSAATTQKPQTVIDAITRFYEQEYGTVHRAVYTLAASATERYEAVRGQVAKFLNASSSQEIVFTRGTTDAINLVAHSYGKAFIQKGDEIIISEMEHHSNIVPWQMLCQEKGALLKIIPITDNTELDLSAYRALLTSRTKLVAVAHMSNVTGTIHPIAEIIRLAHEKGAKVLIDGAQSAAHLTIDVQALDCDFYAFSGHKVFGPTGVGVLYGKAELLARMPPLQGGGDMIEKVTLKGTTYQSAPLKFEAGTPMIAQVIGLGAALSYIESWGKDQIQDWEKQLLVYATEKLKTIEGLKIIGEAQEKGPIISFVIPNVHHLDLGTFLDAQGIALRTGHHCAQPLMQRLGLSGTTRVSLAVYNSFEDIDRFIEALQECLNYLR